MRIEYYHASVYGNGAMVAEEFRAKMAERGHMVNVHHVHGIEPDQIPSADLYLFSSPGRMGKPIKDMRRFMEKLALPAGAMCAILTTEAPPKPDKNGNIPSEGETCRWQRVRPIMNEMVQEKGLVKVAEDKIYVMDTKGPMEEGWQEKVGGMVARICGTDGGMSL